MPTKYIVPDTQYVPDALVVDKALSKGQKSGKKMYQYKERMYLVEVNGAQKKVIDVTPLPAYDFCFTLVAALYEAPASPPEQPEPIYEDYRKGLARANPIAPDFRRAEDPLVMRATIATDNSISYLKTRDKHAGTSTWYGDTPNVISWNGCGAMDAAQNGYAAVNRAFTPERWTNPIYELQYYTGPDWGAQPDSSNHLMGDRTYENPQFKPTLEGTIYRNGRIAATLPWQVIAACEVSVIENGASVLRLRALCAPWLDPLEYNPISGDTDYFFSARTVRSLYLYDENPNNPNGFDLRTINLPSTDAEHTSEAYIAQAPIFSADGTTAFGIIETGVFFGLGSNKQYIDGIWRNHTQSHVLKLDIPAEIPTLVQPASVSAYERDFTDTAASVYSKDEKTQTISVAPISNNTYHALQKIDRITITKNVPDNDPNVITGGQTFWAHGSQAASIAAASAMIQSWLGPALTAAQQWYRDNNPSHPPEAPLPDSGVTFVYDSSSALLPEHDHTYRYHPSVGSSGGGFTGTGVLFSLKDGSFNFTDLNGGVREGTLEGFATVVANTVFRYVTSPIWGGEEDQDGVFVPFPWSKARVTTTLTESEVCLDGNVLISSQTQRVVTTASREIGFGGNQLISTGEIATGIYYGEATYPYTINVLVNQSYGLKSATIPATDVTTGTLNGLRVVAADLRKSAVIVKDTTANEFHYFNIPDGPM